MRRKDRKQSGKCLSCGGSGHWSKNCPSKAGRRKSGSSLTSKNYDVLARIKSQREISVKDKKREVNISSRRKKSGGNRFGSHDMKKQQQSKVKVA